MNVVVNSFIIGSFGVGSVYTLRFLLKKQKSPYMDEIDKVFIFTLGTTSCAINGGCSSILSSVLSSSLPTMKKNKIVALSTIPFMTYAVFFPN